MSLPEEKKFHFRDGTSVSDLESLQHKLEGISYQEFYRHVNQEKNDFAAWVEHVLEKKELAEEMREVSSIVETVEILNDHQHPATQHDDLQSKIEEQVFSTTLPKPGESDVEVAVPENKESESVDFAKIEETLQFDEEPKEEEIPVTAEHTITMSDHDRTRMIVKDFMYGLIFGLIVGLILGRLISF